MTHLLRRHRTACTAAGALLLATSASLQPAHAAVTNIYQWHTPDGVSVMSNLGPPGDIARYSMHRVETPARSPAQRKAIEQQLHADRLALELPEAAPSCEERVALARQRLDQAIEQRDAGREPLPGERLGNTNGSSRLAPWYFERQQRLERMVAQAREQLRAAQWQQSEAVGS